MNLKLAACAAFTGVNLCALSLALAADASFVGNWKFNPDKSKLAGLTYKVENAGNGQYTFVFGDDRETLRFDGKPHTTKYGNTWSITKTGPNTWHWVTKRNGKLADDATWTVAKGGATSTFMSTQTRPDGSTAHDQTDLKRTAGDKNGGLVGTWKSTKIMVGSPTTLEITQWQATGYSMKDPVYKSETNFKLDGKAYTPNGPRVAKGTTVSAKSMGADKMEMIYKLKGKTTEVDLWKISSNGKTLTDTITFPGENKKEVDVFDRQ
jgi:hypothetical protein